MRGAARNVRQPQRGTPVRGARMGSGFDVRRRVGVVAGVLGLCAAAVVVRALDLQVIENDFYQQQGDARFLREIPIPTSRGMITDRNGEPLAVSSPVESLWANPRELVNHPDRLPELAQALGTPLETLRERIEARRDKEFVYLRRHMNPDDAQAIVDLGVPGVFAQREFRRFYPLGEVMSHILGTTNIDDRGQEGLELAFDEWLTGKPGAKKVIRDRRGKFVENVDLVRAAEPGRELTLSIDRRIQYLAYSALGKALAENKASSGSVVVLDVRNGEILAMANLPSYNPNLRAPSEPGSRRNRAVTDLMEPGSTMKTMTVAAALEAGIATPARMIETSPGYMRVGNATVRDIRNFGYIDVTGIITKSSNVGTTKLALEMTAEHQHDVLRRFGFGQPTGSGFPGEAAGVLTNPRTWGQVHRATISYGYGLSATPLQLAQAYAAIGNGGRMHTPTFIKGGTRDEGRQVIDPRIARQLIDMMETVTGPEGGARRANVSGYRVAGKTGTSRRAVSGGYERRYISMFAGLVPASEPRFAMVVAIQDPDTSAYYGGLVAAPVFHDVMDGALRLMDVPPDRVEQWLAVGSDLPGRDDPDDMQNVADAPPPAMVTLEEMPVAASREPALPATIGAGAGQ
ncbi:peptidoglycan D,D-transpeptidase FtsI family protein [Coralloluteibacterium thermophilus]|uniref:Peptidoglycan D,D-transpeptidase FtsI n=1 Tax=Coralloluteibacterium thermophilum TaxID=2707049 RepID=A0ABV9NS33_9GAMM